MKEINSGRVSTKDFLTSWANPIGRNKKKLKRRSVFASRIELGGSFILLRLCV